MEEKAEYIVSRPKRKSRTDHMLSKVIAENQIPYRPSLRHIAGGITSAILLRQIIHWWEVMGEKPYYKFFSPAPDNDKYKEGQSWEEELQFTYYELKGAIKKFAKKITKGVSLREAEKEYVVVYWTDSNRLTWFQFNPKAFEFLYNVKISHYIVNNKSNIIYPITVSQITSLTLNNHEITNIGADAPRDVPEDLSNIMLPKEDNNKVPSVEETMTEFPDLFGDEHDDAVNDAYKARLLRAVGNAQERQEAGEVDLSWLPEHQRPLARAFVEAAGNGHQPVSSDHSLWRKTLNEWFELKFTPNQITNAIKHMRSEGLTIGGIQSVTKTARDGKGGDQEVVSHLRKITSETQFL